MRCAKSIGAAGLALSLAAALSAQGAAPAAAQEPRAAQGTALPVLGAAPAAQVAQAAAAQAAAAPAGTSPAGAWDIESFVRRVLGQSDAAAQAVESLRLKEIAAKKKGLLYAASIGATTEIGYTLAPSSAPAIDSRTSPPTSGFSTPTRLSLNLPILPQLSFGASYLLSSEALHEIPTIDPAEDLGVTITYRPFAYDAAREKADLEFRNEILNRDKALSSVELDARKRYAAALAADTKLVVARRAMESNRARLEILRLRREQGLVQETVVSDAVVAYYESRIEEVQAAAAREDARILLSRLAKAELSEAALASLAGLPPAPEELAVLAGRALGSDVELIQGQRRLDAARRDLERSKSAWQSLGVSLSGTLPYPSGSIAVSLSLSFSPSLLLDVEAASIAVAQAGRSVENRKAAVLDAVGAAFRDLDLKRITLGIREEQLSDAKRQLEADGIRFDSGELLKVDYDASALAVRAAEAKVEYARADLWISWYSLLAELAG